MLHRFDSKRAGFTLIEMLAVLLIISILSYFLITNLGGATTQTQVGIAKNKPLFPRMILSPRTKNELLSVILTNALSLSSLRIETRTSVISTMRCSPRSHP